MSEQIGNTGLYQMSLPVCRFPPNQVLPCNLDVRRLLSEPDEARDELVRRLLEFSLQKNEWVGVSWPALLQQLERDATLYELAVANNLPSEQAYKKARQEYARQNKWTLGVYGYYKPPPQKLEDPELLALEKKAIWSSEERRSQLGAAATRLRVQEYLRVEFGVYYLTPNLVWKYVNGPRA